MKRNTRLITGLSLLAAMSIILISIPFLRFSIIPAAPYLVYDAADIPIMIGAFLFGPIEGLLLTVIVSFIQGFLFGGDAFYGTAMHIIATGTFVLVGGFIYKYRKTISGALLALSIGALSSVVIMVGANLLITPFYLHMPVEFVKGLIFPAIVPFNLIKFGINAAVCFILYKRLHKVFDYIINNSRNVINLRHKHKGKEESANQADEVKLVNDTSSEEVK